MKNMQKIKFLTLLFTKKKKKDRDERGAKACPTSNTSIRSRQVTETDSVAYLY